jgi:hypothetical protein
MAKIRPTDAAGGLAIAPHAFDEVTIATLSFAELPLAGRTRCARQLRAFLRAVANAAVSQRMLAARTEVKRGRERLS